MRTKFVHKPSWKTAKAARKLALTNDELLANRPNYAAMQRFREACREANAKGCICGDYVRDVD